MRGILSSLWSVVLVTAACGSPAGSGGQDAAGAQPPALVLLAGDIDGPGQADGTGSAARFNNPEGVAVDAAGNLYVTDSLNNTIRKVTPAGAVTTLAGAPGVSGSADGTGSAARFNLPQCPVLDAAGNLYVADAKNNTIRVVSSAGDVTTLAGTAGVSGSADGTGAAARFNKPSSVALDSAGNVYVSDRVNQTIRKITPAGVVTTLAGSAGQTGSANGTGPAARFFGPSGVAVDSTGNVYVSDTINQTIRKITPAGVVTTLAGEARMFGSADGTGALARFSIPECLAIDSANNLYVADSANDTIRKVTPAGTVTTLAGSAGMDGSIDGAGPLARFNDPVGVAMDSAGNLYVADTANDTLRKISRTGQVTTLAGAAASGSADGAGAAARFNFPQGVVADSAGNVYVADSGNETIRKITPAGVVTTPIGAAEVAGDTDGPGAAARFLFPQGMAMDAAGNLYVADSDNNRIRKITPAGVVSTLAGTGAIGSADGPGAAAQFSFPIGVVVDSAGNLYVSDSGNSTLRKITPAGMVSTLAGTAGMFASADGTGADARFNGPGGLAIDSTGNLYVADSGNNTIRKVTSAGVVTTLAGTAGMAGSTDGAAAEARFNLPEAVAVDSASNLYVADTNNSTIRKITPAGVTTTIGGVAGQIGIALGGSPRFAEPSTLAILGDGLVIADTDAILLFEHVVR